jgi:hypothetical protein
MKFLLSTSEIWVGFGARRAGPIVLPSVVHVLISIATKRDQTLESHKKGIGAPWQSGLALCSSRNHLTTTERSPAKPSSAIEFGLS